MSIERLARVVPPPERPGDPFVGRWRDVEARLGTPLPGDYKDFVRRYGRGEFMELVRIWTPDAYDRDSRLEVSTPDAIQNLAWDEDFPFPLWPAPGGLLPFGDTIDGDYLCWVTGGPADAWTVAVLDRGMLYDEAHRFSCDMTDFLAGLATGEFAPPSFPDDMLEALDPAHMFVPDSRGPAPLMQVSWRLGPFGSAGEGSSVCRLGRR